MAVASKLTGDFSPIAGVSLATTAAGIKRNGSTDLVLLRFAEGSTTAGVFTRNAFCAAPVTICREKLGRASPRAFIINSGNANCAVGEQGRTAALRACTSVAGALAIDADEVLPFSTGVIGEPLPVERIEARVIELAGGLSESAWPLAARGIMTTDTRPKLHTTAVELDGGRVSITGICKGAGMIRPDMATLLVFIATDAAIETPLLRECLAEAVRHSFNRITIDSDTSTNDSCMLTATGRSGVRIRREDANFAPFLAALKRHCATLAGEIVRDAEGASKFVEVRVEGGGNEAECLAVAYSVADSPLVKTAISASDANWGRIVMAIGKAGVAGLNPSLVDVYLDSVRIVRNGGRDPAYTEALGAAVMAREEFVIRIGLGRGGWSETVWTSDLSHEYVRINAEYRT